MAVHVGVRILGSLIPPNHNIVRIGIPKYGEKYVECEEDGSDPQARTYAKCDELIYSPVIIVEEIWQYPSWLGGAGVRMDESGKWFLFDTDWAQYTSDGCWLTTPGNCTTLSTDRFPLWQPPPCDDWTQSWHPNPRYEEKSA